MFNSYLDYLTKSTFDLVSNCKFDNVLEYFKSGRIIGLGAVILNGYSYENLLGNITYYCNCKELDGLQGIVESYIYLPDYPKLEIGLVEGCNHTNPERTICDFIMYPKRLGLDLWVWDLLEGYQEEYDDDWSKVYEMMDVFGIPRSKLDELLEILENMEME